MIKEIIYEYWENELPEAKPRHVELRKDDLINDIVGIRRCGKTFLMFHQIGELLEKVDKKSTIYINFENRKLFPAKTEYFNELVEFIYAEKLLDKGKVFVFLDEVQRVEGWEKSVRSIYDEFKGKIRVFVSGSSSNLLSREYGKLLTGRHITTTLMPLSFREFLLFKGYETKYPTEKNTALIKKFLEEYLEFGGFPEVVLSENKEGMLNQLFTDIVSRDILTRSVRKENVLEEFAYYLAANITNSLSFNKMASYFHSRGIKASVPTLENYFWLIKNSFLFFDSLVFSYKIRNQNQAPRKIYCIDNGIANLVGFKFSKNLGRIYENTVFLKLKRDSIDNPLIKIYYWKSQLQEEVDFVVKEKESIRQLIQVCYDLENAKEREIKSLVKAGKELRCKNLMVITNDYEAEEKIKGKRIRFIPLWKWLLD